MRIFFIGAFYNPNVKIGYLGDSDKIEQLQKEVELQSKVKDEKG